MNAVLQFLLDTLLYVLNTLLHNSPALVLGILTAAAIQTYIDPEKMKAWLMRRSAVSIPATVAFGAFTPFCACGTMAVVISMLATALPWGPVMAFLTSSPLMSPEGFVMMSGILGPMFAVALAVSSVLIGLGSGYATHVIEKKTHFLDNQLRFLPGKEGTPASVPAACGCSEGGANVEAAASVSCCADGEEDCGCGEEAEENPASSCCEGGAIALQPPAAPKPLAAIAALVRKYKIDQVLKSVFELGVLRILPYFALFAAIGYAINRLIPTAWVSALFGADNLLAVPLAALVGLPLYINGDSSIPLIQSLMQGGVSGGAMLAFLITGPGTSAGVLAGIATIMKRKAIALYVAYLFVGAAVLGYAYNIVLMFIGK